MPIPSPTESASAAAPVSNAVQSSGQPAGTASQSSNLMLRNDTILGVCEAIGRDFGFNPNWLRIPLAGGVLISPIASFGIYFALGIAVLLSRLIAPAPRRQIAASPQAAAQPQGRTADNSQEELSAAA